MPLKAVIQARQWTLRQPVVTRAPRVVTTNAERRARAHAGSVKKQGIDVDIKAAWAAQDELAVQLAAKHGKKIDWMQAKMMRHGGPKNNRKVHRVSTWNAFLHYHSHQVNEGMYILLHVMSPQTNSPCHSTLSLSLGLSPTRCRCCPHSHPHPRPHLAVPSPLSSHLSVTTLLPICRSPPSHLSVAALSPIYCNPLTHLSLPSCLSVATLSPTFAALGLALTLLCACRCDAALPCALTLTILRTL